MLLIEKMNDNSAESWLNLRMVHVIDRNEIFSEQVS